MAPLSKPMIFIISVALFKRNYLFGYQFNESFFPHEAKNKTKNLIIKY